MAVRDFLEIIRRSISVGQNNVLNRYLEDVRSGRVSADPERIENALAQTGDLLPMPNLDPTTPDGYNAAIQTILSNIAGLYQEVDSLEAIRDSLADLNTSELDRIEVAVRDLGTLLESTRTANAANVQYTDVFFETFGADVRREDGREWYKPIPILASSGQVESFLPLQVDTTDRSLKLLPGGNFSRSTNSDGDALVQVSLDEILGLSVDINHPTERAFDGRYNTFWRETIVSDAPIQTSPLLVPWLPRTYTAGSAARLHFKFPFATPFTEILIHPFARFPMQILQVVWDNRDISLNNRAVNGNFVSGGSFWTVVSSSGAIVTYPTTGGYKNGPYANVFSPSGRVHLINASFSASGEITAYHLRAKIYRPKDMRFEVLVQWHTTDDSVDLRADSDIPESPEDEWFEYSKLFLAPSGWADGYRAQVSLVADGSGSIKFTDTVFAPVIGVKEETIKTDLESDVMSVELDNAKGTDIWLTVGQPHYEFLQVALPEGELEAQDIWDEVRLQAEAKAETVLSTDQNAFLLQASDPGLPDVGVKEDGSMLLKEVNRLGGKMRNIVFNLLRYSTPSPRTVSFNKYMYILGAWEIQIRHKEYAPQGLYVSQPYKPRGEVREVVMLTNPPLSELNERIRFWMTARSSDQTDRAKLFNGRATFSSSTETADASSSCHFTLPPVTRQEIFDGSDRLGRIALSDHPYINRTSIWTIASQLASGSITLPRAYDPNTETAFLSVNGEILSIPGYRPLKVTLEFPDGIIARPDVLGQVRAGDVGLAGPELVATATVEQQLESFNEDVIKRIQTRVGRATPANRQQLLNRLVNQELNRQQLRGGRQTKTKTQRISLTALKTKFENIVSGPKGVALSLYWHKSADDISTVNVSGDVLISPSKYTVDTDSGVIILRDSQPNNNPQYNSFTAYYYFHRGETGSREAFDSRSISSIPVSGVDFDGSFTQSFPITRNMTDYVYGQTPILRQPDFDDFSPTFYPVYEYFIDDRGRIVFAQNLHRLGDTPARITVEYDTLLIEPRLIIEFRRSAINDFSTKTPVIKDFTLLMNSRR